MQLIVPVIKSLFSFFLKNDIDKSKKEDYNKFGILSMSVSLINQYPEAP